MARLLALNTVLFLLPFVAYAGWLVVARGSLARHLWPLRVVATLSALGIAAMLVALVGLATFGGAPPEAEYRPAVLKDGEIVPGDFE